MKYIVSVVIPVYNVQKYLDRCIQSVTNQTYKNLEIILVDDGSPDECPQICDEWAKKDSRIIVVHKTNGGVSSARNLGMDKATGRFLMFVDSDDYIDLSMIEKMVNAIEGYDCVYCKYNIVNGRIIVKCNEKNISHLTEPNFKKYFIGNKERRKKNEIVKESIMGSACRILFDRNKLKNIGFDTKIKYSEDFLFMFNFFETNPKINFIDAYFYNYCVNDVSYSSSVKISKIKDYFDILPYLYRIFNGKEYKEKIDYMEIATIYNVFNILYSNGKSFNELNEEQRKFVQSKLKYRKIINFCKHESSIKTKINVWFLWLKSYWLIDVIRKHRKR